jgi:hypothetical protein
MMSVLRTIEQKIEGLFEGVFGRAFRTNVQPVELARKLTKEMDDHRMTSVSRTYAPNEFTLFLSSGDRTQFKDYEPSLVLELQDFLAEHARRESYVLLSPPTVTIETDGDLPLGHFGIATRMVQTNRPDRAVRRGAEPVLPPPLPDLQSDPYGYDPTNDIVPVSAAAALPEPPLVVPAPVPSPTPPAPGMHETMIYSPPPVDDEEEPVVAEPRQVDARLTGDLGDIALTKPVTVFGRAKECDVVAADLNVSRRHAEIHVEGGGHWLVDLDSTNGTTVNGKKVKRVQLAAGDRIGIGSSELVFERSER